MYKGVEQPVDARVYYCVELLSNPEEVRYPRLL